MKDYLNCKKKKWLAEEAKDSRDDDDSGEIVDERIHDVEVDSL